MRVYWTFQKKKKKVMIRFSCTESDGAKGEIRKSSGGFELAELITYKPECFVSETEETG